jgi:hypothetical protein
MHGRIFETAATIVELDSALPNCPRHMNPRIAVFFEMSSRRGARARQTIAREPARDGADFESAIRSVGESD